VHCAAQNRPPIQPVVTYPGGGLIAERQTTFPFPDALI